VAAPLRRVRSDRTASSTRPSSTAQARARGQSLVEFALVLPLFMTMTLALLEFAFVFNAILAVNYASRDAALLAAEAGDGAGADCIILRSVEQDLTAPTDRARVSRVEIYESNTDGAMVGTATVYQRGASTTTCTFADGTVIEVPYLRTANGYPEASRCAMLAGCGPSSPTLDLVGVRISYAHAWITPLRAFIAADPNGFAFDRSNVMRMEPVL
jgi:Flp pilus assembly protein TadG